MVRISSWNHIPSKRTPFYCWTQVRGLLSNRLVLICKFIDTGVKNIFLGLFIPCTINLQGTETETILNEKKIPFKMKNLKEIKLKRKIWCFLSFISKSIKFFLPVKKKFKDHKKHHAIFSLILILIFFTWKTTSMLSLLYLFLAFLYRFYYPLSIRVDNHGNYFIADAGRHQVKN